MDEEVLTELKILIIGETGVGKSSFILQFADNTFSEEIKSTIGMDYKIKEMVIDGNRVKLNIWDTAGQERFKTLIPAYYRDGQGVILMYDVTNRNSLLRLDAWINELQIYTIKPYIVKMVVGNKTDLPVREVSTTEGLDFARRHNTLYIESSAKTADNVTCCFEELVQKILQTPGLWTAKDHKNLNFHSRANSDGPRHRMGNKGFILEDSKIGENVTEQSYCSSC